MYIIESQQGLKYPSLDPSKMLYVDGDIYCFIVIHSLYMMLYLTLNEPIATKVICFSHLLKCLRSLFGN